MTACASHPRMQTVISVATPLIMLALAWPIWMAIYGVKYRLRRHKLKQRPPPEASSLGRYIKTRMVVTAISIVFYAYPNVTQTLLFLFSCPVVSRARRGCSIGQDPAACMPSSLMVRAAVYQTEGGERSCLRHCFYQCLGGAAEYLVGPDFVGL